MSGLRARPHPRCCWRSRRSSSRCPSPSRWRRWAGALPEEGGYVAWVRRAFGPFWSFQVGWWSWLNSFVDVAVYPALFADYLRVLVAGDDAVRALAAGAGLRLAAHSLNLFGVRITGWGAVGLCRRRARAHRSSSPAPRPRMPSACPWSAVRRAGAGAVERARSRHRRDDVELLGLGHAEHGAGRDAAGPRPLIVARSWWALPLIALAYIVPVAAATGRDGRLAEAGRRATGRSSPRRSAAPGSRPLVVAGAIIATAGLFLSLVLTNSRLPYALALEGQLPRWLAATHPRTGVPWAAVIVSSAVLQRLRARSFKELIVLNVWLYSLTLLLELAAFVGAAAARARARRVRGGSAAARPGSGSPRRCRRRRRSWLWRRPAGRTPPPASLPRSRTRRRGRWWRGRSR